MWYIYDTIIWNQISPEEMSNLRHKEGWEGKWSRAGAQQG